VLWGVLGTLLRFLPYIGSYIAAVLPILLAAAVGNGWSMTLWTALLYIATELIMSQAVEPVVYGHSTGLSPFSVVIAAIFWTWLWGPMGLILSTPLTLCLVVLGRHVEQLEFLDVMLGDQPALTPTENFYQRILAGDADEAEEQAEQFLADHSLREYYDEVVLEGLQLAASDANRGVLTAEQIERINLAVMELVAELADHDESASERRDEASTIQSGKEPLQDRCAERHVLCVAGRGPLDETASVILAQLLEKDGFGAVRTVPHHAVSRAQIAALGEQHVAVVCVVYLDINGAPAHLRFLIRRIRQRLPNALVVIGFWPAVDPFLRNQVLRQATGADYYVSSLREALDACRAAAHNAPGIACGAQSMQEPV
jgi:AI-2E family transporter